MPILSRGRGRGQGRGSREVAALIGNQGAAATSASADEPGVEGFRPSKYRGVTQERRTGNWRGQLWLHGKVCVCLCVCHCMQVHSRVWWGRRLADANGSECLCD